MPLQYPFSAVLGCGVDPSTDEIGDPMGLALVLTAISPGIGGVLVRGEKGTAKSTAVRGLAEVLPWIDVRERDRFSADPSVQADVSPDGTDCGPVIGRPVRLVELPVGATEDRVLGSLHLERALTSGRVEFEPGLLAAAHRGVLYVDEVNLLHDHLVDLLLDAAATGQVSIERDGMSLQHTARFVLIGTMNPEEGELRPQLLDRFGLTVEVAASRDPQRRVEVVRRRLAYDADPAGFVAEWAKEQSRLTERIERARLELPAVVLSDAALVRIAEVCAAFEVDGLRADIVTARTAVAHAAWSGRDRVTRADIRAAALLALPHRRRRDPFDAPGLDEELLDRVLGDDDPDPPPGGRQDRPEGGDEAGPDEPADQPTDQPTDQPGPEEPDSPGGQPPGNAGADPATPESGPEHDPRTDPATDTEREPADPTHAPPPRGPGAAASTERAQAPFRPRLLTVDGVGQGSPGRRSRALGSTGRRVGARAGSGGLHLVETLRAAADRIAGTGAPAAVPLRLQPADLRTAIREGRESNLLLFCVDASGSMAARRRMVQVKTAILSLLTDAYRRRDRVGLVTFRGAGAELTLPPTGSVEVAAALLDELPAGGRTPLAEGLLEADRVLRRERLRDPRVRPLLLVVTDGRATQGADAVARSRRAAQVVSGLGVPSLVIDSETGPMRMGLARVLAGHLRAEHLPMAELTAGGLTVAAGGRVA